MSRKKISPEEEFKQRVVEDIRPWGKFRSYPRRSVSSIKIITVRPRGAISLQFHRRRSEFWVVLDRGLEVTVGDRTWRPQMNEEIFIPRRVPHRLRCLGCRPGRVMEVWIGSSGESDIVRLQDQYGRK